MTTKGIRRYNPVSMASRSARRFSRRSRSTKMRTMALIMAVVVGLAYFVATAPKASAATATPESSASTSTRGVSAKSINVVFPLVSLNSLAGKLGFAEDAEYGAQATAIHIFVNQINNTGGINGRKIHPDIVYFDPENETQMEALCKDWTEGSPSVFAVLDGLGTYTGESELCVTQDGHTPMISQWTTVSTWTKLGSPYLWWTGPDDAPILKAVVSWGLSSGTIGKGQKLGILAGDRASDQDALNDYLLPDLRAKGIIPIVETIAANPSESATTGAEAPLDIAKFKSEGVTSIIPLIPFNVFFPVLQAQHSQKFYPHLLLSDYEESIESALGLIPIPYNDVLNGQEGLTTETLGGFDDNRPEKLGGYDPGVRNCYNIWHKAHPGPIPGESDPSPFIEEQGPVQAWCGVIELFAHAAKMAGHNLNRRTFVEAMAKVKDFPGTWSPILSYGPNKFAGPVEYQIVRLHNNVGANACVLKTNHKPQGTCWQVVSGYKPLPSS